jgi:hypothetical protein
MATASNPHAYARHAESRAGLPATPAALFDRLDDHARLSAHMTRPSWRMGWARMTIDTDEGGGKAVGSRIRLDARVLGLALSVEEVVTEREPPYRKVWQTVGTPRLLVIGPYRMGFELLPEPAIRDEAWIGPGPDGGAGDATELRVFIDYDLPRGGLSGVLGRLFGAWYASWCTERMVADAVAAETARRRVRTEKSLQS